MRAQHLLEALEIPLGDAGERISGTLAKLCGLLANGRAPEALGPWLAAAPVHPLRKKDGGVRPIAVGEVLRRLVARMLCNDEKVRAKAVEVLGKVGQMGVGRKNGAEAVVHAVRSWVEGVEQGELGGVALKLDIVNAFNSVDRGEVLVRLREHFPDLVPWFLFCYGQPAHLSCQGRWLPFVSETGIQQGDPLAPLLFSLGIKEACRRTREAAPGCLTLWYLDDGMLVGPLREVQEGWRVAIEALAEVGLSVDLSKCGFWGPGEGVERGWGPRGVKKFEEDGFQLLGVPVGSGEFCREKFAGRVRVVEECMRRLAVLDDPQAELCLIRCCLGMPRLAYALRTVPPGVLGEALRRASDAVLGACEGRLGIAARGDSRTQWNLPVRMGGFGVPDAEEVGPCAFVASVVTCEGLVREVFREAGWKWREVAGVGEAWRLWVEKVEDRREMPPEPVMQVLKKMGLCKFSELVGDDKEMGRVVAKCPKGDNLQHFLTSVLQEGLLRRWVGEAASQGDGGRRELMRRLAVSRGDVDTGYAGNWLNVVPARALGTKLEPAVFGSLLRLWAGEVVCGETRCPERTRAGKQCGEEMDVRGDHALVCPVGSGRIARHNEVNKTWLMIQRSVGLLAQREVRVVPDSRKRHADTFVWQWDRGRDGAHDWVIPHVLAKEGLKRRVLDPWWAVERAEEMKRRAEKGQCAERGVEFVPMALDTFGGFGESARKAIVRVANEGRLFRGMDFELSKKRIAQKLRVVMLRGVGSQIVRRLAAQGAAVEEEQEDEVHERTGKEEGGEGGRSHGREDGGGFGVSYRDVEEEGEGGMEAGGEEVEIRGEEVGWLAANGLEEEQGSPGRECVSSGGRSRA